MILFILSISLMILFGISLFYKPKVHAAVKTNNLVNTIIPQIYSYEWSDLYFINKYVKKFGVRSRPNLVLSIMCAKKFLNWYICGQNDDDISLTITGMFGQATIPSGEKFLFASCLFLVEEGQNIPRPKGIERKKYITYSPRNNGYVSNKMVVDWYHAIYNLLDAGKGKQRAAINYLSFLAMTMMRCIKSPESFYQRIPRISEDTIRLWNYSGVTVKSTPMPKDTLLLDKRFQRFGSFSTRCLTFIIAAYVKAENSDVETILMSSCLLNLRLVGMDCYRWSTLAAKALDVRINQMPLFTEFEETGKHVRSIYETYDHPLMEEKSWLWARLLEETCFNEVSTESDPKYTMIMANLANENDITKIFSLKKYKDFSEEARKKADEFRAYFLCKN